MGRQQQAILRSAAPSRRRRAGEMAGNATAECTAVCCCLPCTVMDIVVLAAYKVPKGLVKKARKRSLQQKKIKKMKKETKSKTKTKEDALLVSSTESEESESEPVGPREAVSVGPTLEEHLAKESEEAAQLEAEMWAQFNGAGFWRSGSQRQQDGPEHLTGELNR